jgi:hypothetical protein
MPKTDQTPDALIGAILTGFLKVGPQPASDGTEIGRQVLDIVRTNVITAEQSTDAYKTRCDAFLKVVVKNGGLPVRAITTTKIDTSGTRPKRQKKQIPLDRLHANHKACIDNYRREAHLYLEGEISAFRDLLQGFIRDVPAGGTKESATRRKITAIKQAFRDLLNWDRLFSTVKNNSFPASLRRTFDLEGNPIAAIWRYSVLDEQGEFRNAYSHKDRTDRVYAVRGNWAIEKGLMKAGPDGFIDETIQPGEEFDCMCSFQWVYNLRALPDDMRTTKGNGELERARRIIDQMGRGTPAIQKQPGFLRRMMRRIGIA